VGKGHPRSNDTHASTTDPDARLFRKSHNTATVLAFQGHVLTDNRSGLVVGALVTHADGQGERAAALAMLDALPGRPPRTLGADKGYDTRDLIDNCRRRRVTPHVAVNDTRIGGSAIDGRTTRHSSYPPESDGTQARRRALRLGQDRVPDPADTVQKPVARRPALQAHDDGQQHRAHGTNTDLDATRSHAMRCSPCRANDRPPMAERRALEIHHPAKAAQLARLRSIRTPVASVGRNSTAC
jgi:hypothetical protein